MNQRPGTDSKYASAQGPVNRRTALREARPEQGINARVQQQVQVAQARQWLGAPLSQQLGAAHVGNRGKRPVGVHHAVLALAPIVGLAGAWMGWQQASMVALAAGGALLVGSVAATAWALRARRRDRPDAPGASAGAVFDADVLARIDKLLNTLAPLLPPATLERLASLKGTLVRMTPLMARTPVNEHFTLDDRLYVVECVSRYLPDSLQGWLQVPAHLRDVPPEGGGDSPQALLDAQLDLLQAALREREHKLGRAAAESLQRQQRFLEAKHPQR
ncbi:hypothetical protein QTI66_26705 [Variovorax sp. J22R133]|uniref:hypothetical protein n=1 Tax=Variovorax brevis TaxID=3053503 RepID=UPI0025750742|nr:hypothetical protein [Variovorax sp. J22R133]MDM0115768.1 hypothetical protein [Variovorax sp. J22R133]